MSQKNESLESSNLEKTFMSITVTNTQYRTYTLDKDTIQIIIYRYSDGNTKGYIRFWPDSICKKAGYPFTDVLIKDKKMYEDLRELFTAIEV
jgi:hypothetical protein